MNYYPHHIGDYLRDTSHLSTLEDGTYRRMLDLYYSTEKPLPLNINALLRLLRAKSTHEKNAVQEILSEFFTKTPEGWRQARADTEISKAQEKSGKAKASAAQRWRCDGNSDAMRTHSEGNAPNNQEPITNNQEPVLTTSAADAPRRPPKVNGHRIEFDPSKGAFKGISEDQELRWQEAYPAVPIPPAISQAASWLQANPANRKSNYERFLVNWFKRDQDKAARVRK